MEIFELRERAICFLLKRGINDKGAVGRTVSQPFPSAATQGTIIVGLSSHDVIHRLPKSDLINTFFEMLEEIEPERFAWDQSEQFSVWATARALRGLLLLEPVLIADPRIVGVCAWLREQRNPDGGYGFKKGLASRPLYTHYVVMAFHQLYLVSDPSSVLRTVALSNLINCGEYLLQTRRVESRAWGNGTGDEPCPVSTMLSLLAMNKILEATTDIRFDTSPGRSQLKKWVANLIPAECKEGFWLFPENQAVNWTFEEFLPGRLDLLFTLFDVDDPIVKWALHFLQTRHLVYDSYVGWSYPGLQEPVTWVTALAIQSLTMFADVRAGRGALPGIVDGLPNASITPAFLTGSVGTDTSHGVEGTEDPLRFWKGMQTAPTAVAISHRRVRILHISDLHTCADDAGPTGWRRRRVLGDEWARNLEDLVDDGVPDLICFTGDLVQSGKPEEYSLLTRFVDDLLTFSGVARDRLFVVPGNHDVDRTKAVKAWRALRGIEAHEAQSLSEWMAGGKPLRDINPKYRDEVLMRQAAYRDWVATELRRPELLSTDMAGHPRLGYRVKLSGWPIHIIGLDSAWLAGDKNDQGKLRLTDDQVGRLTDGLTGFRLALVHHPLTDLADGTEVRRLLSKRVDLLLRGHLHEPELSLWNDPDRSLRELAAGCLYQHDRFANTCQLIDVSLDAKGRPQQFDVRFRAWSSRGGFWHDDSSVYRGARDGKYLWKRS